MAQARTKATNAVIWGVIFGIVFVALVWLNLRFLVGLLGASGRTLDQAVQYLSIVVPTLPLLMVGMIGGAILRSHGDAKRAMMATIYGGLANAVLDPILIFGFGLDLTGAAIATVVARFVIAGSTAATGRGQLGPHAPAKRAAQKTARAAKNGKASRTRG